MNEEIPTAAKIYADDSFPTPEPSLRIRAEWQNVNFSEGDEMVMREHIEERLNRRIKQLKKRIQGPSDSSEAKARKDELESLKSEFNTNTSTED